MNPWILLAGVLAIGGAYGLGQMQGRAAKQMQWDLAEAERTASIEKRARESAIDSQKLIGDLYEDLKRQAPAVAGYQRDILFVCSGVQPVHEAAAGSDTAVPAGIGSLQREITAAQRAEFAAVVAADIGNCADAIPKRNSAADWIVANGG